MRPITEKDHALPTPDTTLWLARLPEYGPRGPGPAFLGDFPVHFSNGLPGVRDRVGFSGRSRGTIRRDYTQGNRPGSGVERGSGAAGA